MGGDEVTTKSGLMVGLGETHDEMVDAFGDLREHGVQVLTVGQYLRPTERHLPVVRYWHPDEFKALEDAAYELGFDHIAAGPLVPLELPRRRARPAGPPRHRPARRGVASGGCSAAACRSPATTTNSRVVANIREHGWHAMHVRDEFAPRARRPAASPIRIRPSPRPAPSGFSYTVGLWAEHHHPELVHHAAIGAPGSACTRSSPRP